MSSTTINRPAPSAIGPVLVNAAVATAQVFFYPQTPALPYVLNMPGSGRTEQKEVKVTATGKVTTAGAYTVTLTLLGALVVPGAPLVAANWTTLGASTARAVGTTTCPFKISADMVMDSTSGKIQGSFNTMINNLVDSAAALTNVITGASQVGSTATEPVAVFAVAVTFSAANAGNSATLGDFVFEC